MLIVCPVKKPSSLTRDVVAHEHGAAHFSAAQMSRPSPTCSTASWTRYQLVTGTTKRAGFPGATSASASLSPHAPGMPYTWLQPVLARCVYTVAVPGAPGAIPRRSRRRAAARTSPPSTGRRRSSCPRRGAAPTASWRSRRAAPLAPPAPARRPAPVGPAARRTSCAATAGPPRADPTRLRDRRARSRASSRPSSSAATAPMMPSRTASRITRRRVSYRSRASALVASWAMCATCPRARATHSVGTATRLSVLQ